MGIRVLTATKHNKTLQKEIKSNLLVKTQGDCFLSPILNNKISDKLVKVSGKYIKYPLNLRKFKIF
jgi:hypothetical protein